MFSTVVFFTICAPNSDENNLSDEKEAVSQPNVLFIICDDLNDAVEGMGGHPQAITPNIKMLASRGMLFTNAHSNHPICAPSRASLFSGIYPHKSGVLEFNHWSESAVLKDAVSLFEHFKANGYQLHGTGKLHAFAEDFRETWTKANGQYEYGIETEYGPFAYNGITHQVTHPSMAYLDQYMPDHNAKMWTARAEHSFGPLSDVPIIPPSEAGDYPGFEGWYMGGKQFRYNNAQDRDSLPDEKSAQWAVDRLLSEQAEPFLMGVGFIRPHTPLYVPKKYFDTFSLETIQLPPYKENDLDDCQGFVDYVRRYGFSRFDLYQRAGGVELWKKFLQAYLASVAFVDEQVGKVLDALDKSKYAENTIIVFTSDHGFHLGEKDYNFKLTNWEEASRVPLIIVAPGVSQAGSSTHHPVSLVDLYSTLNDLCNLPNDPNQATNGFSLDGHSLKPFLLDPKQAAWEGPEEALIATYGETKVNGEWIIDGEVRSHNFSLRSENWRYTLYENGSEELYDHRSDPNEWNNLASDQDHATMKQEMHDKLIQRLKTDAKL